MLRLKHSADAKKSKLWLYIIIGVVVVALLFAVYWFKFRDDAGGFSKV
jgi:flagellar basal body-associated protein FliL